MTVVGRRELAAAGIESATLRASYEACRRLNAQHGKTYYLATLLLPPAKRPYVHALYGFARYADEIVDAVDCARTAQQRSDDLWRLHDGVMSDLARGDSEDLICRALVDTAQRWDIPHEYFEVFLRSMVMDLTVTQYATYEDLRAYMYGSAAVVGLQMLPILGTDEDDARMSAEQLGVAFQLANMIRDVAEDLDRGRLYLPLADLAAFDLTREHLEQRIVDDRVRELLRFEISRVRALTDQARPGIELLEPSSRPCVTTALTLYGGIVDEVERADYDVFSRRRSVSRRRRLATAAAAWPRAWWARREASVATPSGRSRAGSGLQPAPPPPHP